MWGLRHYRKEFAETDPSSPLRAHAAANVPDADAVGVVFWYDAHWPPGKQRSAISPLPRMPSESRDKDGIIQMTT